MSNGDRAVTIEMVAAEAGVSKTTVSFVLNNNPVISLNTRRHVLDVIERLGYQPNMNARNLSSRKIRTICAVVPEIGHIFEDPYFARGIGGLYDEIEASGYRIIMQKASYGFAHDKEYLNLFKRKEVAGMLYIGSTLDDEYLVDFVGSEYPFVLVNSYIPGKEIPYVIADNVNMGYLVTHHLIGLGHRRIGHIFGSMNTTTTRDRLEGYKKALAEAEIRYDPDMVIPGNYNRKDSSTAARLMMSGRTPPTAIYAGNDNMAIGVMEGMAAAGLKVGADVSVVGNDDIELAEFTNPGLTTVHMSVYDISRAAVRLLMDIINGQRTNGNAHQVIPTHLVVRGSCGAAPANRDQGSKKVKDVRRPLRSISKGKES